MRSVPSLARVKVPVGTGTPRFLQLPDRNVFVPLEQVMAAAPTSDWDASRGSPAMLIDRAYASMTR